MTKQRELILQIVRETTEHLTAEEIFLEAKKRMPSIALATVYNNLNYLSESGAIAKIGMLGQTDRYDKMFVWHDHMICDRCGHISDLFLDGLRDYLSEKSGENVLSYELTVHHICPACRAAETKE